MAIKKNVVEYVAKLPIIIRRFLSVEIVVEVRAVGGRSILVLVDKRMRDI